MDINPRDMRDGAEVVRGQTSEVSRVVPRCDERELAQGRSPSDRGNPRNTIGVRR